MDVKHSGLATRGVTATAGDRHTRLVNQDAENSAVVDQRIRESLTSLPLQYILQINEQNRSLPVNLRQSRSLYHGSVSSGFTDPLTNPFSRFVWHAKDDRYYVTPTESTNSFRRQHARQQLVNLAASEALLYPSAAKKLQEKEDLQAPSGLKSADAEDLSRIFRNSYHAPTGGVEALRNADARYRVFPTQPERLVSREEASKDDQQYANRIKNYMIMNESARIQDAQNIKAFSKKRYRQNRGGQIES